MKNNNGIYSGAPTRAKCSTKGVPLDFGLDKTFALYFCINTTNHPNNEIAVKLE